MSHVILSKDASGEPRVDEVGSLDEALRQVERLRNEDGVSDVRVLREVPIEVKTYYKVVAVEEDAAAAPSAPPPAVETTPATPPTAVPSDPPSGSAVLAPPQTVPQSAVASEPEEPSAERRGTRFGRS